MIFGSPEEQADYEAVKNGLPPPSGNYSGLAYMYGKQAESQRWAGIPSSGDGGNGILFLIGIWATFSVASSAIKHVGPYIDSGIEASKSYIEASKSYLTDKSLLAYNGIKSVLMGDAFREKQQSYALLPAAYKPGSVLKQSVFASDVPFLGPDIGPTPWQENYSELATSAKGRGIVGLAMADIAKSKRAAATIVTFEDASSTKMSYLLPPAGKLSKQYNILTCAAGTWNLDKSGKSIKNDLAIFPVPAAGTVVKKPQIKHRIVSGDKDCKTILTQQAEAQYGKVKIVNQFAQPQLP